MYGKTVKTNRWLSPISWLYGLVVETRNKLFDWHILPSEEFAIPIISVGNLAVGGTGKTPHVEYLIELLRPQYRIAVLSRGYKRKSRGFVLANEQSTVRDIGDEPYQMKQKYPDLVIAVDGNRRRGIKRLQQEHPDLDAILLDDAFQHRYVTPLSSIVLTDYNRALHLDRLLPAGRLRESKHGLSRADIVIVTKCPDEMKPIEYNIVSRWLHLFPYQSLYFTRYIYGNLQAVFPEVCPTERQEIPLHKLTHTNEVLVVTGIANPQPLLQQLTPLCQIAKTICYPDHHNFSPKDLREITAQFSNLKGKHKYVITTEKDAARLQTASLDDAVRRSLYYLPIQVEFMRQAGTSFDEKISDIIYKNRKVNLRKKW